MTRTQDLSLSNVVPMPVALGKTEQRIRMVIDVLTGATDKAWTYPELIQVTGMPYDALLYVLHAFAVIGVVEKVEVPGGPGRPRVTFQWMSSQVLGTRKAASG